MKKEAPHLPNAFSLYPSYGLMIDSVLQNTNIKDREYSVTDSMCLIGFLSLLWVCLIGFLTFAILIKVI